MYDDQDEQQINHWVDPHQLKKIKGQWRKGDRVVVTAGVEGKRRIIAALHNPPMYGHPGIRRTTNFVE
jgi:hypothetical protein